MTGDRQMVVIWIRGVVSTVFWGSFYTCGEYPDKAFRRYLFHNVCSVCLISAICLMSVVCHFGLNFAGNTNQSLYVATSK